MKIKILALALIFITAACKTTSNTATKQESSPEQSDGITEKYWKLVEINGKPVEYNETMSRDVFIILKNEDSRLTGNGGCNALTGTYIIDRVTNRIRFSQIASTMMACINMEIENELKKALEMADNYSLSEDGKYLSLNRARMAPLARFEVIYLQ